ncbi:MAG: CHASE domain-containing protein, partial [Acidobacteriota bacterium]
MDKIGIGFVEYVGKTLDFSDKFRVIVSGIKEILKSDSSAKLPFIILAVSILVTIGATYNFYQTAENKDTTRFNNEVGQIQSTIENKINLYIALLKGGRGFIESTDKLDHKTFADYVNSLGLDTNYVGVEGIGYSKVFLPNERRNLIERMKSEGFLDFKLSPETERNSYQAVLYLEPSTERNRRVIGFDMSTEKNRSEALFRARDSGQAAASAKVTLLQENEQSKQAGFLIFLPIYKRGSSPSSIGERRENLLGYIYSPFRAEDFLDEIQKSNLNRDIAVKIYDGENSSENLLAQNTQQNFQNFTDQINKEYTSEENLNVAGRNW